MSMTAMHQTQFGLKKVDGTNMNSELSAQLPYLQYDSLQLMK